MLGDRLPLTPTTSPPSSPRPSPKPEDQKEVQIIKEIVSSIPEEPSGLDGKTSKQELIQTEALKSENNTNKEKEKKTRKKSSWFNSFYPTYKSRSEDFKRIFKEVPDEERLVVDYSCAVQKEILLHGRLYVTQNYLCFYSNIFGWETNIVLKWKEVAAITKEKTALVIPNAVLISTKTERYFFTSFVARDKVYLMLFRVWQNALMDRQMSTPEMWQWVHQSYGAELGLTSDDEDYIAPGTEEGKLSNRILSESMHEGDGDNSTEVVNIMKENMSEEVSNLVNGQNNSLNSKKNNSDAQGSTDMSDSDFSDLDIPAQCDIQSVSCSFAHDGRQIMNETFPIHVDQLFTLLFTSSKFWLDFHASRKTTDLVQTPWTQKDSSKTRVVTQTVAITQAIGPKTSQVTETQVIHPCSKPGVLYSITSESVSGGVPYGDSFFIEVHYCIKKVTEKQCSLTAYAQVKFRKSIWGLVKGMIEKNVWSGLDEFFLSLSKALRIEAEENVPDIKRKIKRKRKLHCAPREEAITKTLGPIAQSKAASSAMLVSERATIFIFFVLIFLLFLNVMLYRKLWSLEEEPPAINSIYLQFSKNPPTSQDEWLRLLQKQEQLHAREVKNWHDLLTGAINSLKQTETILQNLQQSINSKIMGTIRLEDVESDNSLPEKSPSIEL